MKNLVIAGNLFMLGALAYSMSKYGLPSKTQDMIYLYGFIIVALMNLFYIYENSKEEGESLISLWFSVRKKKLKDELKDND